jgi:hypothetical protein
MKYIFALVFAVAFIRELSSIGFLATHKNNLPITNKALLLPIGGAALFFLCAITIVMPGIV